MDETTIIKLVSLSVGNLLDDARVRLTPEQRALLSQQIAESCWDGLLVMLRHSFATSETVQLQDVGYFQKAGDVVYFHPAAPIAEVVALGLEPENRDQHFADMGLFCLNQAIELLSHCSTDVNFDPEEVALEKLAPEERLLRAIFGEKAGTNLLTEKLQESIGRLTAIKDGFNLSGAEADAVPAEAEIGKIYHGKVVTVKDFGAFVEFLPGKDGLVHISELADFRVKQAGDIVKPGDDIWVKCLGVDEKGRVRLSRRAAIQEMEKEQAAAKPVVSAPNLAGI